MRTARLSKHPSASRTINDLSQANRGQSAKCAEKYRPDGIGLNASAAKLPAWNSSMLGLRAYWRCSRNSPSSSAPTMGIAGRGWRGVWEHGVSHPKVFEVPLLFRLGQA